MNPIHHKIITAVLQPLQQNRGAAYAETIAEIVNHNLKHGRVDFSAPDLDRAAKAEKLRQYVLRVVDCYDQEAERVEGLQIKHDPILWKEMYTQVYQWAWYNIGKKWPTVLYDRRRELAGDVASEASLRILDNTFFYDTPFEAWVRMIVWYVTYEVMRRYIRDTNKIEQIEDAERYDLIVPPQADFSDDFFDGEMRGQVWQAIGGLSEKQRTVILRHYIEDKSLADIAEELKVDPNNVYQLHYQGLKNLRRRLSRLGEFV